MDSLTTDEGETTPRRSIPGRSEEERHRSRLRAVLGLFFLFSAAVCLISTTAWLVDTLWLARLRPDQRDLTEWLAANASKGALIWILALLALRRPPRFLPLGGTPSQRLSPRRLAQWTFVLGFAHAAILIDQSAGFFHPPSRRASQRRDPQLFVAHSLRQWDLRPGFESWRGGDRLRVNSLGNRGSEPVTNPGVFRIAFVGDSLTFGWEVAEAKALPWATARLLNEKSTGRPVVSDNFGVPGYAPWQAFDKFLEFNHRQKYNLIVYSFCLNDVADPYTLDYRRGHRPLFLEGWRAILDRSGAFRLIYGMTHPAPSQAKSREVLSIYNDEALLKDPETGPLPEAWGHLLAVVGHMADQCKERGIPFVVAVFPYRSQATAGATIRAAPQRRLAQFLDERAIPWLDVFQVYSNWLGEHGAASEELYLENVHPNSVGHGLAAEALAEFILARGFLPSRDDSGPSD